MCLTAVLSRSSPVVQDDPQADQLLGSLDHIGKDLVQVEKEILNRVRSPVNYSDPTDDLARRIKHQQVGAAAGGLEWISLVGLRPWPKTELT